jgi:chemotaxis protein CheX
MEEDILKIFARSTERYFSQAAAGGATLGTPYLRDPEEEATLGYSAIIGISGEYRGGVYYTTSREKLDVLLPLLGEAEVNDDLCADLVGEIANSISGNAREELGAGFMISTPFVLVGHPVGLHMPKGAPCYVLPVSWRGHASRVLVTLSAQQQEALS